MSRDKRKTTAKFVPPSARVLQWNPKGKPILFVMDPDEAYLRERGRYFPGLAQIPDGVAFQAAFLQYFEWVKENISKSHQEREEAFAALVNSTNPPRWISFMKNRYRS